VASAKLRGSIFAIEGPRTFLSFSEVLDERPSFSVVGLNAQVGQADEATSGERTCDLEARALLGGPGGAQRCGSRQDGWEGWRRGADPSDGIGEPLAARYLEVAAEMAPYRQRIVYEVYCELSFYEMNDSVPLRWSNSREEGHEERRGLLEARISGVERILDASQQGVSIAQLLDAAACLWTARRIASRAAVRIPTDPEWDSQGLRIEIVR
jgi:predicted RNase H-like nuclease